MGLFDRKDATLGLVDCCRVGEGLLPLSRNDIRRLCEEDLPDLCPFRELFSLSCVAASSSSSKQLTRFLIRNSPKEKLLREFSTAMGKSTSMVVLRGGGALKDISSSTSISHTKGESQSPSSSLMVFDVVLSQIHCNFLEAMGKPI